MSLIHNGPLAHRDTNLTNTLYFTPVGTLLQADKAHLQHSLARVKLVCHWLEGILKLVTALETKGE